MPALPISKSSQTLGYVAGLNTHFEIIRMIGHQRADTILVGVSERHSSCLAEDIYILSLQPYCTLAQNRHVP